MLLHYLRKKAPLLWQKPKSLHTRGISKIISTHLPICQELKLLRPEVQQTFLKETLWEVPTIFVFLQWVRWEDRYHSRMGYVSWKVKLLA